jgi:chemotaxis signal transduction protein
MLRQVLCSDPMRAAEEADGLRMSAHGHGGARLARLHVSDYFPFTPMTVNPGDSSPFSGSAVPSASYLLFRLGEVAFGVRALMVHRILSSAAVTAGCWGGCDLRAVGHVEGRVVPIFQLNAQLDLAPAEAREGAAVLVLRSARAMSGELLVGLMVDAVGRIIQVSPWSGRSFAPVTPPCPYVLRQVSHEGETLNLLDLDSLFTLEALAECCMSGAHAAGEPSTDFVSTINNQEKSNQQTKP